MYAEFTQIYMNSSITYQIEVTTIFYQISSKN